MNVWIVTNHRAPRAVFTEEAAAVQYARLLSPRAQVQRMQADPAYPCPDGLLPFLVAINNDGEEIAEELGLDDLPADVPDDLANPATRWYVFDGMPYFYVWAEGLDTAREIARALLADITADGRLATAIDRAELAKNAGNSPPARLLHAVLGGAIHATVTRADGAERTD